MAQNAHSIPEWIQSQPRDRQEIYFQAKSFLEAQDYSKAREHIDRLFELLGGELECTSKGLHELFALRAEIKLLNENEIFEEDFLTAYQISNPKHIGYLKRASLKMRENYSHPGLVTLICAKEWVNADPNDMEAKIVLLEGIESRKNMEDNSALRHTMLEELIKKYPDHPDFNYHQAMYLLSKDPSSIEAIPFLMKAVDAKPENEKWRTQATELLLRTKQWNKALKYLLVAAQQGMNAEKLEDLAKCYEYLLQWKDAIETRDKTAHQNINHPEKQKQKNQIRILEKLLSLSNAADTKESRKKKVQQMIHLGSHMSEPAVSIAAELEKENPQDVKMKVLRMDAKWMELFDAKESKRTFSEEDVNVLKESKKKEKYWRTHFLLGFYFQITIQVEKSLKHYRLANELKPKCCRILKMKSKMERSHGDIELAFKDYGEYFQVTSDFELLPNYIRFFALENRRWKKTIEAIELAQKVGIEMDFTNELEYCKKHLQLDEEVEKNPSAQSYEARGNAWLQESKLAEAQADYNKALQLSPGNSELIMKVGKVLLEGNKNGASEMFSQAIALDPSNAEAYHQRSLCQLETAIGDAEKACELQPENTEYLRNLKLLYKEASRFEDAAGVVKKMIELFSAMEATTEEDLRPLKIELATYYQHLDKWTEAATLFRQVNSLELAQYSEAIQELMTTIPIPRDDNMKQIAEIYQKIIQQVKLMSIGSIAENMIKKLLETEPHSRNPALYGILGQLAIENYDREDAQKYYKKAAELDPNDNQWAVGLLASESMYGASQQAMEDYINRAMKLYEAGGCEFSKEIWHEVAYAARMLQKHEIAMRAYQKKAEIVNDEKAWTDSGFYCEDHAKNNQEALKCYLKAVECSPNSSNAWNNCALIYNKIGNHTEAFRCAQKSIELNPKYANPYAAVAMVYLSQGKLAEAKEYAEKSIRFGKRVPRGYFVLGQVMEQKQQFHEAKRNYEEFLSMYHPDPDLRRMAEEGKQRCENRITTEEQASTQTGEVHHYHLFLSHYQRTGGLLAMVLKLLLEQFDPTLKIFLDVDDLENIHDLKANVRNSDTIALLITEGVFERRFVVEEITMALELGKNIVLIWDKERCPWPDPKTVPDHLQKVLLIRAIIWNAEKDFRNVVVKQIDSKITRSDKGQQKSHASAHHANQQPSVSPEQFDQLKSSIQQQFDSFSRVLKQNTELLFTHQNQMFQQMQANFLQLQQKVDAMQAQAMSVPLQPSPQVQHVQNQQPATPASSSTASEPAQANTTPASANEPTKQPQPVAQQTTTHDTQAKSRSESSYPTNNNNSPIVKPRAATEVPAATPVKQIYTMEGWLHKLGGWNKTKWESRYFTCDGTVMVYHASQQIIQVSSPKGTILLKDILAVEEVGFDVHKVDHCFAVQTPSKKYFFFADDELSKVKWIAALRKKPT